MNFLSSLFDGLLGLGTTAFKTEMQKSLMDKGYDIWSKQQSNAMQLKNKDMLAAGINPAAFYGGSGGWKASN